MTTKEEYAEAANYEEWLASIGLKSDPAKRTHALAASVLRQLAEGAVLCERRESVFESRMSGTIRNVIYVPIEEQPC